MAWPRLRLVRGALIEASYESQVVTTLIGLSLHLRTRMARASYPCHHRRDGGATEGGATDASSRELHRTRRFLLTAGCVASLCVVLWTGGCQRPRGVATTTSASFTVGDILHRCVARYEGLTTLHAKGLMRDYRSKDRRVSAISWDFARPDRCRLQIETDVAVILEDSWSKYDASTGRYRRFQHFTKTPIQTPAHLLSNGVPFLLPVLLREGGRAFGKSRRQEFAEWTMEGVEWHAEHPCYVLSRTDWGQVHTGVWRVWVDQDLFLVRGWALLVSSLDGHNRTVMGCSYFDLTINERLPAGCFDLKPPKPILLSLPNERP